MTSSGKIKLAIVAQQKFLLLSVAQIHGGHQLGLGTFRSVHFVNANTVAGTVVEHLKVMLESGTIDRFIGFLRGAGFD